MPRVGHCVLFDWGDTLVRVFPEYDGPMYKWPRVESLPQANKVLEVLQTRWVLALATNAQDSNEAEIRKALRRVGLEHALDHIFCFRSVGYRKPSPLFYNAILDDLQVDPRHAIMVDDDFETDVVGANRCSC